MEMSCADRRRLANSYHLWMRDESSLKKVLAVHGLVIIRRAQFGDCADSAFQAVENSGRFERACAMRAVKS